MVASLHRRMNEHGPKLLSAENKQLTSRNQLEAPKQPFQNLTPNVERHHDLRCVLLQPLPLFAPT
jgi:hypothetical protein